MAFELERVLFDTEDYLLKALRSGPIRQAKKRRMKRKFDEALRRTRRAAWLLAGLLLAMVAVSIVTPISFFTWLVAIPTAFFIAFLSFFWPTKAGREEGLTVATPLGELASRAADGLIDRFDELPGRAIGSADRIVSRLNEVAPHLDNLHPDDPIAGDSRRLICQHLPRLVDTYLDLPPSLRKPGSEASNRLSESLDIVATELDDLLERCCRDRRIGFETQHRFIETRYKDGGPVRSGR
jgi:hypothetical protein